MEKRTQRPARDVKEQSQKRRREEGAARRPGRGSGPVSGGPRAAERARETGVGARRAAEGLSGGGGELPESALDFVSANENTQEKRTVSETENVDESGTTY